MPGIAGIIGRPGPGRDPGSLDRMVGAMRHEDFDASGTFENEELAVRAGWAAHAGSFSDGMPVWNETRDVALFFAGEDFTEPADIGKLRAAGHDFAAGTAAYLVHLYEDKGEAFLEGLNGTFSGLLLDLRRRSALLFTDRYGAGRLYWAERDGQFYFASEAKALLAVLRECRRLDPAGLAEMFSCGCVMQNRSLFPGISVLPPASAWTFAPGSAPRKARYFRPETWEGQERLDPEGFYRELKRTWGRVVPKYLRGPQPVAVSLTGGKDSRMIMAWLDAPPGSLPCYSFGGMYRNCFDVRLARRVAGVCRQPFQVIRLDRAFLADFPRLAERTVYLTDGIMDVSGAPELYVNRLARDIAPVRLTGNYGQEILAGSVDFQPQKLDGALFSNEFSGLMAAAAETYAAEREGRRLSFVAFKQVPWFHISRLSIEQAQLTPRSPILDNDVVALSFRAPESLTSSTALQLRLVAEGRPALARFGTDRGLRHRPLPLLTRLTHELRQFSFKAEYAFDYGMPPGLVRIDRLLRPFHPERLFLGRHKFYHFRVWYRDALSGYVKDVLLDPRTLGRPYLAARRLEEVVRAHTEGRANHTRIIHKILTAELIHRLFID